MSTLITVQSRMFRHPSRVKHGRPVDDPSKVWPPRSWRLELDCGHVVHERAQRHPPGVGAQVHCHVCDGPELPEVEGCGGDAILDRMVP